MTFEITKAENGVILSMGYFGNHERKNYVFGTLLELGQWIVAYYEKELQSNG